MQAKRPSSDFWRKKSSFVIAVDVVCFAMDESSGGAIAVVSLYIFLCWFKKNFFRFSFSTTSDAWGTYYARSMKKREKIERKIVVAGARINISNFVYQDKRTFIKLSGYLSSFYYVEYFCWNINFNVVQRQLYHFYVMIHTFHIQRIGCVMANNAHTITYHYFIKKLQQKQQQRILHSAIFSSQWYGAKVRHHNNNHKTSESPSLLSSFFYRISRAIFLHNIFLFYSIRLEFYIYLKWKAASQIKVIELFLKKRSCIRGANVC